MYEFIEELKNNKNDTIRIDYVIEKLQKISVAEEFVKGEIYFNIENMVNDDYLDEETKEKLAKLEDEDIKDIIDDILYDDYLSGTMNDYIESALYRLIR